MQQTPLPMSKRPSYILKSSGLPEPFSRAKLERSLRKAGASPTLIAEVWEQLEPEVAAGISSAQLQRQAFRYLKRLRRGVAARYQLKQAIMELGPSGYPFERLMGELFKAKGYEVQVGQVLKGRCVQHEVDVVGARAGKLLLVECKYRNLAGYKCDIKVPLYIHSRFEDIRLKQGVAPDELEGWIATNARFSTDAIEYARCVGMHLLGWDYPHNNSLKDWLDELQLYPLTVLTTLSRPQKQHLLERKLVLCRDILERPEVLLHLPGKTSRRLEQQVMNECAQLLQVP